MDRRLERVKRDLCPRCPIRATCPQWEERLAECADADDIQREDLTESIGRDYIGRLRRPSRVEE